jgi:hypothetical protein
MNADQMQNAVNRVVNYLVKNPFKTENQITKAVFKYDRNNAEKPNRQYATILREALNSGTIGRQDVKVEGIQSRYFYYVPRS